MTITITNWREAGAIIDQTCRDKLSYRKIIAITGFFSYIVCYRYQTFFGKYGDNDIGGWGREDIVRRVKESAVNMGRYG